MSEYGLSDYDAGILTADKSLADLLEATVQAGAPAEVRRELADLGVPALAQ